MPLAADVARVNGTSSKGPFIATQLNSTRRRVELSCVAINGPLDGNHRSPKCGSASPLDFCSEPKILNTEYAPAVLMPFSRAV